MLTLVNIQIIIDMVFFIAIMFFLRQLSKRVTQVPPIINNEVVGEFKRLITDSQDSTSQFLRIIEEHEGRLNKLSRQLDNKERRLVVLLEEAESLMNRMNSHKNTPENTYSNEEKSKQIIQMIKAGISREDIARKLGVTDGEINLITAIEQIKTENA